MKRCMIIEIFKIRSINIAQNMKLSIKDFFSKWSHLLQKFLIENFSFFVQHKYRIMMHN